ncbi:hypothetical protein BV22DRAFT_1134325 [Leucogyrophana mollusca]|uniref:Uncharacterized protein n=1 Tax=Leucogyrophana mollusca TaxID=85980 RepID=A0ACB8B0Z9_9AGAM|nr:hypothetical protein BV22DRAFT_1134325 [Leucogyrophana mollusca]
MSTSVVASTRASGVNAPANTADETSSLIDKIAKTLAGVSLSREAADALIAAILLAVADAPLLSPASPAASVSSLTDLTSELALTDNTSTSPLLGVTAASTTVTVPAAVSVAPPAVPVAPPAVPVAPPAVPVASPAVAATLVPPPIPFGHKYEQYGGRTYCLPISVTYAPLYYITKGRHVGVVALWHLVAPLVIGVRRAAYGRADSIEDGRVKIQEAIDAGSLELL